MKKRTKCYIYTRVSTSIQVDGYSLDAQKDKLRKFHYLDQYEGGIMGERKSGGVNDMNQKKKDMYLPAWICGLGVVLLIASVVFLVMAILKSIYCFIGVLACLGLGVAAILCWKNQWVMMVDEKAFVYSTMFGKQINYRFSQIQDIKQNADSFTIILDNGKVHVESCAIMSEHFLDALNAVFEKA